MSDNKGHGVEKFEKLFFSKIKHTFLFISVHIYFFICPYLFDGCLDCIPPDYERGLLDFEATQTFQHEIGLLKMNTAEILPSGQRIFRN